ncbi:protein yippee-like 5 [Strongylocentrotus purpuratus]|uniref:Yippee domain-containing protein n=2 Tax=Echinacea TaxID=7674 RepID=A0A7M7GKR9_STRPU|nr:protein yippee-like 5 [Strongylocentrotus purpuratus]
MRKRFLDVADLPIIINTAAINRRFRDKSDGAFQNSHTTFHSEEESIMGRVFLEHIGGTRLFSCANCDTVLTNRAELMSTRFTGSTGRAYLFKRVVNLSFSEVQDRIMLTGRHMVRDVFCKNCDSKLGWIYEFATEESQRYKEGKVILERALITESEGMEEHVVVGDI